MNFDMIFLVVITSFIIGFVLDLISSMILDRLLADKRWQSTKQDKDQAKNLTDLEDEEDEGTDTLSEEEFEEINQAIKW
ncbi:15119_t:CDS:2 [Cetraspora pellucida]|uniref:15119_t:CDS:1 n=1 Tax=Cetraspora pellucida TaxID=1433469 RepID=A0ACA9LPM7_9GLOM|nr:15119_t:CDS:2 [Cetraspora pellucida]